MRYDTPWGERPFAPQPGTRLCRVDEIPDGEGRGFEFGVGVRAFRMSDAEAKALGLRAANAPGIDGWVASTALPAIRSIPITERSPASFDFIDVAEHEIAEVMGRYGMTQNGCGTTLCDSPIDLFRYTSPGNFDRNPEKGHISRSTAVTRT